mgnify:CR=1 FL=1
MNSQRRFQQKLEFTINLIALILSHCVTFLIFGIIIPRIDPHTQNDRIEYCIILALSTITVSLFFSSSLDLSTRNRSSEFISTLRNCFLTYGLFGALLILTKNPLIDSRYLFISSFAVNLNCIPLKSLVSTKDVSISSLKAILLFTIKVPVGCSFFTITSLI